MKRLVILTVTLFLATSSFAAELSEAEVKTFLADWLAAQNTGSYSKYAMMYSNTFIGIRRSGTKKLSFYHDEWLEDRKHMFRKKMTVTIGNVTVKLGGATATVKFEQEWKSGAYHDKGDKILNIRLENTTLKITAEEMLFSKTVKAVNTFKTTYTAISDEACKKNEMMMDFTSEEYAAECPAIGKWKLFKVYDSEGRSWINLAYERSVWSPLDIIRYDSKYNFGYFPTVDGFKTVEWILSKNNNPHALILGVTAQSRETNKYMTRFVIVQLSNNTPRICGMADTKQAAEKIAYDSDTCTIPVDTVKRPTH